MDAIWPELDDEAWLSRRLEAGASDEDLADELGCPVATVR